MAYSNDGAHLAVIDEKKTATVYSVADGYSVNICLSYTFYLWITQHPVLITVLYELFIVSFYNHFSLFFLPGQKRVLRAPCQTSVLGLVT